MPVDNLGDYDVTPVSGNPFGAMADSPANYSVEPVGHDPFASPSPADIADKYVTRSGQLVPQQAPTAPTTSMVADKYTNRSQISDPEWMRYQEDLAQDEQRTAEWGAATETFHPQTMGYIGRAGGTLPSARAAIQRMYPSGPEPEMPQVMQRAYSDLMGGRGKFSGSVVSQGGRGRLADIGAFGSPLMAPRMVGHPGYQLRDPFAEQLPPQAPPEEGPGYAGGGAVQLNADLRRRLALITQPRHGFQAGGAPDQDPNAAAFSQIEGEARAADVNDPASAPAPAPPPVYGGAWGQSIEDAYQYGMGKIGAAQDWLGNKLEQGVGTTAAAVGVPGAKGLARDVRAAVMESGELGPREMPHEAPRIVQGADGILRHADPAFQDGRIATPV
jgi:hypothetical protein